MDSRFILGSPTIRHRDGPPPPGEGGRGSKKAVVSPEATNVSHFPKSGSMRGGLLGSTRRSRGGTSAGVRTTL